MLWRELLKPARRLNLLRMDERRGKVVADPFAGFQEGDEINFRPLVFGGSGAGAVPEGVVNWTFFEGALMSVCVGTRDVTHVVGTAVMIAPGLAITALHVLSDDALQARNGVGVGCVGPRTDGLTAWNSTSVVRVEPGDIALVSLKLASPVDDQLFRTIPITTRKPRVGEKLFVIGFRREEEPIERVGNETRVMGELVVASGQVTQFHFPQRDSFMCPYPVIEIECGSHGGMSGGAVFDTEGHLIGIISASLHTDDNQGPTQAAWIGPAFSATNLDISWPPGVYRQSIGLLEIPEPLLNVEGRERLAVVDDSLMYLEDDDKAAHST